MIRAAILSVFILAASLLLGAEFVSHVATPPPAACLLSLATGEFTIDDAGVAVRVPVTVEPLGTKPRVSRKGK